MDIKSKPMIAAIVVVAGVAIAVGVYMVVRNGSEQPVDDMPQTGEVINGDGAKEIALVTEVIEGTIVAVSGEKLTIAGMNGNKEVIITADTSIYTFAKGTVLQKSTADLTQGVQVMVEYDQKSGNATAISIAQ